jgi:uncharacterized protein
MEKLFVDANFFIRFFTRDDNKQAAIVDEFFKKAQAGKIVLVTGHPVIFELAWVLKKGYSLSPDKVLDYISSLVGAPWLMMQDREIVENAINIARMSGQDFADAYICANSKAIGATGILTFNKKHFERMGTIIANV